MLIISQGDHQLIPSIHACIRKRETPYRLGTATNLWDTVYVGNVSEAHALAARNLLSTKTAAGEIYFIQNNEPITFREFSLAVWKEFDHYPPFEFYIPQSFGYLYGILAECWTFISGTPTTISRGSVLDACAMRYASGDKAKSILGYQPTVGLEEGLKRSCKVTPDRSTCCLQFTDCAGVIGSQGTSQTESSQGTKQVTKRLLTAASEIERLSPT